MARLRRCQALRFNLRNGASRVCKAWHATARTKSDMGSFQRLRASRQLLLAFSNSNRGALQTAGPRELPFFLSSRTPSRRHASSADSSKPIILEQPDKFRPPSHPSRLVQGRGRGSTYNGAYNQSSTAAERIAQKNRRYPHMFPDEGTLAHSIITKKQWHVLITMVYLQRPA